MSVWLPDCLTNATDTPIMLAEGRVGGVVFAFSSRDGVLTVTHASHVMTVRAEGKEEWVGGDREL